MKNNKRRHWFSIGYVSALGAPLDDVVETITHSLEGKYSYNSIVLRMSEAIESNPSHATPSTPVECPLITKSKEGRRIWEKMNSGRDFCANTKDKARIARMTLKQISDLSEQELRDELVVHIRSLKRPAEVALYRNALGPRFVLVGIHASRGRRVTNLEDRLRETSGLSDTRTVAWRALAEHLIERDERESDDFGQNVRDTFQLADAFISAKSPRELRAQVGRLLKTLFSYPFCTPRDDEFGMMLASAASRRSAALGRQVGAAVLDASGLPISVGYNEVPAAGGGHSGRDGAVDFRDFQLGANESASRNAALIDRLAAALVETSKHEEHHAAPVPAAKGDADKTAVARLDDVRKKLRDAGLSDLLEFGRDVHAEQSAICSAALAGRALKGAAMYVTTFPCHLCAKHILASGIERVVFIEPYAKSLVRQLYRDIIAVDERREGRVPIEAFIGISPRMFMTAYSMPEREKSAGKAVRWSPRAATPWFMRGDFFLTDEEVKSRMQRESKEPKPDLVSTRPVQEAPVQVKLPLTGTSGDRDR